MKNIYAFLLAILFGLLITGCTPVTSVKMDEQGKGTLTYTMDIKKNAIEETGYTVAKNIDEFATLLEKNMAESLNLKVSIDKTSSSEFDYIIFTTSYNSVDEYNQKVKEFLSQYNQLLHEKDPMEEMFGYSSEINAKDLTCELEALKEYMSANGIEVDTEHRNCRKFAKIMKEYETVEYVYDDSSDDEKNKKLVTKEEDGLEIRKNVRIVEGDNGKTLNLDFMALNSIEMYIRKFIEVKKDELFNVSYVEENTQNITKNANKEILKRTFEKIDLATKIKNAIDARDSIKSESYSMKDFTPVMAVSLFNEEMSEKFTQTYSKEYTNYENEKKNVSSNYDITFENMIDMYDERESQYEVTFGGNTIKFDGDHTFGLYNSDNYIEVSGNPNSNNEVSTSGGLNEVKLANEVKSNNAELSNKKTDTSILNKKDTSKTSFGKECKNKLSSMLDDTPFTGDKLNILLVSIVAIISLSIVMGIKIKHKQ